MYAYIVDSIHEQSQEWSVLQLLYTLRCSIKRILIIITCISVYKLGPFTSNNRTMGYKILLTWELVWNNMWPRLEKWGQMRFLWIFRYVYFWNVYIFNKFSGNLFIPTLCRFGDISFNILVTHEHIYGGKSRFLCNNHISFHELWFGSCSFFVVFFEKKLFKWSSYHVNAWNYVFYIIHNIT